MNEAEWIEGKVASLILPIIKDRLSERKLRLLACACCRALDDALTPEKAREVIGVAERYADGRARGDERKKAYLWAKESESETWEATAEKLGGGWGTSLHSIYFAARVVATALTPQGEATAAIMGVLPWQWPQPVGCAGL